MRKFIVPLAVAAADMARSARIIVAILGAERLECVESWLAIGLICMTGRLSVAMFGLAAGAAFGEIGLPSY